MSSIGFRIPWNFRSLSTLSVVISMLVPALGMPVDAQLIDCSSAVRATIQDIELRADSIQHGTFVYNAQSPYRGSVAIDFVLADETNQGLETSRLQRLKKLLGDTELLQMYSERLMQSCHNVVWVRFMNYTERGRVFVNPVGFYRNNGRVDQLRCVPAGIAARGFIEYEWGQHVCRADGDFADPGSLKGYN